jgi:membrane fusion protein (multidrug efflux system)
MRKVARSFVVAMLILVGSVTCNQRSEQPGPADAQSPPKEYAVIVLQPRPAVVNTDFPATIQGQQNMEIRPKIDGYIEHLSITN